MKQCKLCGNSFEKLAKSHIIPKSFGKRELEGKIISFDVNSPTIKPETVRNNGYFDNNILCQDCENYIGDFDKYGIEFCRQDFSDYKIELLNGLAVKDGKNLYKNAYKNFPVNYKKLKLFVVSILWRASITNHKAFDETLTMDKRKWL